MKRRRSLAAFVLAALAGMVATVAGRPDRAVQSALGLTAHNLCAAAFISQLDPDVVFASSLTPLMGGVSRTISYSVDGQRQSVTASLAGLFVAKAVFTPGFGCRLQQPGDLPLSPVAAQRGPYKPLARQPDAELAAAVAAALRDRPGQPAKRVKALLVVRDNVVIAERYGPGVNPATPLPGWSIAKSLTNALVGVLVRQSRMTIEQSALAPEWPASDRRARLTVEDLLRMRSGLDAPETGSGGDIVNRMLYGQSDMAHFAASRPLAARPGTMWDYSSANTLLLDRAIGRTVGGGASALRSFAERELFAPLGMASATIEFDGAGTFIGSSYFYASAEDYARLGLLYLHDGVGPDGGRILPAGWARWSARSTLGRGYGAGFWTNDGPSIAARQRVAAGFPADGFFASGNMGQRIYVVPSTQLVIVRLGDSDPPGFGIDDDLALIAKACTTPRASSRVAGPAAVGRRSGS